MTTVHLVKPKELLTLNTLQNILVDVRTHGEYVEKRLAIPHTFIPLDTIVPETFLLNHGLNKQTPLYCICQSGSRAQKAADMFLQAGCSNIYVVEGGITACSAEGLALTGTKANLPPQAVISIERQVRIAAGAMVAIFTLLGLFIAPVFLYLSLFVGLGLMYAGITNWCGLMLVLSKAPWNKASAGSCASGSCTAASSQSKGKGCQ